MKAIYKIGMLGVLAYGSHLAIDHFESLNKYFKKSPTAEWPELGEIVYNHNGVAIYSNGGNTYESHGKHYSSDGFYYGKKWQCVEFIKRYLYDAKGHKMPNPWGHAKHYFDANIPHSNLNPARNLSQFRNFNNEAPQVDDLLVWNGKYGHVAIVAEVHNDYIIIAQQNIKNLPMAKMPLTMTAKGNYILGEPSDTDKPLGWLRIP